MEKQIKGFSNLTLSGDVLGMKDDPPVVLVHGGGETRDVWDGVAEALVKAGRQVFNFDLRGHGESDWSQSGDYSLDAYVGDLRAILSGTNSRPVVVAASVGGWIASVAIGESDSLAATGLVLVDSPPQLDPSLSETVSRRLVQKARSWGNTDWDERFVESFDIPSAIKRVSQAASNIQIPVLYIRGADSPVTDGTSVSKFVKKIPDCEYVELEAAGHQIINDQTENFNSVLLEFLERRIPRLPTEFTKGSDTRTLRNAMGCFATGVTVVTAMGDEETPVGLTANSFTSVSLEPPLLLVCIDHKAESLGAFEKADGFAVNILHIGQQPISNRFASRGADKFKGTEWEPGLYGAPVLHNTVASYECRRYKMYDGGDHVILLGEVERARFESHRDPLLYFKGKYRRLHLT